MKKIIKNASKQVRLNYVVGDGATLSLDSLHPLQGELKSLSKENYKRLKRELLETGVAFPIRAWHNVNDKKVYIIGGHQTVRVLKQMRDKEGYTVPQLPVTWINAQNMQEAKRRVLQDVSQYGKVDRQGLYEFMHSSDLGMDELIERFDIPEIDLETFKAEFEDLDVGLNAEEKAERLEKEDEVPEVKGSITKLGDVYKLGNHRLLCGDSTKIKSIKKLLNGVKPNMIFTDPPYKMVGGGCTESFFKTWSDKAFKNDKKNEKLFETPEFSEWLPLLDGVCSKNFEAIIFSNDRNLFDLLTELNKSEFKHHNILIWKKNNKIKHGWYMKQYEAIAYYYKGKSIDANIYESNVIEIENKIEEKEHISQKPIKLLESIIKNHPASIIFEPFGGSGSTLIACEKTQRQCYMMEIDPHYCDIIVSRYVKYTNNPKVIRNGKEMKWKVN